VTRAAALAVLVLATGCGARAARPAAHSVEIRAFRYRPDTLTVARGDTVAWTNHDVVPHTATVPGAWDTGQIGAGASGRWVAGASGTYAYACAYHPGMKAVLVVR
jgi:plastocyanin